MNKPMTSDSEVCPACKQGVKATQTKVGEANLLCSNHHRELNGYLEQVVDNDVAQGGSANTTAHSELAPKAQSEAPSVDDTLNDLAIASYYRGKGNTRINLEDEVQAATAKINRLIVKAYNNGFSDGKKIHPKYEVGDIGGNYRITERFRRVGKNTKYKVVCTLCGAPMFRYSNKFNLRHKDCGAL